MQKTLKILLAAGLTGLIFTGCSSEGNSGDNSNSQGNSSSSNASSENKLPVAKATATPSIVTEGEVITFDASQSSDVDGQIVGYQWKEGSVVYSTAVSFTKNGFSAGEHTVILTVTDNDNATATDSVTITVHSAAAAVDSKLKKTGQTVSYDENGNIVTDGSVKDDGYYKKGVSPNYTRDDDKQIVTDHITGLQWQDDENASSILKPWLTKDNYDRCKGNNGYTQDESKCYDTSGDTAATYCTNLELGGYSDWRLPTVKELQELLVYTVTNPAIDTTVFNHYNTSYDYWSSTTYASAIDMAWIFNFENGHTFGGYKHYDRRLVRCVR